jgi:hypothetical protein
MDQEKVLRKLKWIWWEKIPAMPIPPSTRDLVP